jgi:hypothetical protein
MSEVSHIISRCVDCSTLTKVSINQFVGNLTDDYLRARFLEESEIIVLCTACREKQKL